MNNKKKFPALLFGIIDEFQHDFFELLGGNLKEKNVCSLN